MVSSSVMKLKLERVRDLCDLSIIVGSVNLKTVSWRQMMGILYIFQNCLIVSSLHICSCA